jgi:hypothetical protein
LARRTRTITSAGPARRPLCANAGRSTATVSFPEADVHLTVPSEGLLSTNSQTFKSGTDRRAVPMLGSGLSPEYGGVDQEKDRNTAKSDRGHVRSVTRQRQPGGTQERDGRQNE